MIITIPFKTPSVNHLHNYWRGHVSLSKEARELKKTIKDLIPAVSWEAEELKHKKLRVTTFINENWLCLNGDSARKDVSNREKFLIDAVFDALGIDDKYIWEHRLLKVQSQDEKAVIIIEEL